MKVLIIDDEPLIRRSLERLFSKAGHEVQVSEDGVQGAQSWKKFQPDAVMIDVLMPGMTGPEVIAEVRPDQHTAIALISAFSGDYNPESVKQFGADVFIEKPFADLQVLVPTLEKIWEKKKN